MAQNLKTPSSPGPGRRPEGRVRMVLYVLPEVEAAIAREVSGRGDTPGKALERLLETRPQDQPGSKRAWSNEARERLALKGQTANLKTGTAAALRSPRAARGTGNAHAKAWRLRSPKGKIFQVTNLHHFVREHPELFEAADVIWKRTGGKRGTGGEYCNATAGIQAVRAGRSAAWKGWSLKR